MAFTTVWKLSDQRSADFKRSNILTHYPNKVNESSGQIGDTRNSVQEYSMSNLILTDDQTSSLVFCDVDQVPFLR
jgi:hypothetical protein